jgi:ketosteroid isomerase-like protein
MTTTSLKAAAIAASSLMLLGIAPAYAGADAIRAEAYFNAISGGNVDTITSFYAEDAEFHWVGGPLAGVYKGKDKIKGVWDRFTKAAGDLDHEVLQIAESANGKTSTVTARVKFKGEGEVPVKFIMVYKDGKIASEVWQVDKAGATYAKADGKPVAKPEPQAKPAEAKAEPRTAEPKAGNPVPPVAKPAPPPVIAAPAVAPAPAARPAAPAAAERKLAQAPDQPPAELDDEPGGPDAEDRPEDADAPEADTAEAAPSPEDAPAPGRKAEFAPEKDLKPAPKLGGEPKLKGYDEKKPGYGEKFEEKKIVKKKKPYYGYDHDDHGYGYGRGWRGYGHGYGGYGHGGYGHGGYGRGGYGHY